MELYEAMRTTFAAREYTGESINDEILYSILENARFAPSGGNRQGNRVIVVGGGWLGCDIAVYLARLGKEVVLTTVKEAADDLIPNLEPFSRKVFMDMMESSEL